jgi:hypothetical protein
MLVNTRPHDATEQAGPAVTLWTCIRHALGSNLGWGGSYTEGFRNFPQSFQEISRIIRQLAYDRFLSNPFQFIIFNHLSLFSLDAE